MPLTKDVIKTKTLNIKIRLCIFLIFAGYWGMTVNVPAVEQARPELLDKSAEQAVDDAAEKIVEKAAEAATEGAVERAAEKAAEKAVEKAAEKAAEKAVEKAAEKATEKAAEQAAEKAVEKAAEEAVVKAEQVAKRPDESRGATLVHFFIYLVDVDEIDSSNQNFTTNVYLRLRWKDPRLAKPGGSLRQVPMQKVWNPRVLLVNRQGLVSKSLPEVVDVEPDGTVIYHQRYTGKLSQIMDLSSFPLDTHDFTVHLVSTGYSDEEVEFVADTDDEFIGGGMAENLSLPDWEILESEAVNFPYEAIKGRETPGFAFRFKAKRYFTYYIWQVVLPLAVVVVMSWAGFWVDPQNVGVRIGVVTSSVLTLIAHRFVLASLLPRLPYMTRMDYFTVGCTLLVFFALIMVVATSYFSIHLRYKEHARKVDGVARALFPAIFLGLLTWFVGG